VAKGDHREEADNPGHDHRGLDDARGDVADRDARVVQLAGAVERNGGANVADHGEDLEERSEEDLRVVPSAARLIGAAGPAIRCRFRERLSALRRGAAQRGRASAARGSRAR
jgi:hypothetical protein